jgi:hypothetical protein
MFNRPNNFPRRKRRGILIASSVVALLTALLFIYEPSSPDGVYYDQYIACGHGCWIFKDGKISIQCDEEPPKNSGAYYKSGNQWAWGNNPTNMIFIKPSLFGVKVICKQFQRGQQFWPRDSLSWMASLIDFKDSVLSQLFP